MAAGGGRIHILGLGNLGLLYAHSLARISPHPPPVTLLFHRHSLFEEWKTAGNGIEITTNGVANTQDDFEVEEVATKASTELIHNLIVTTKAPKTRHAIESVRHRLCRDSTILFCQNGMGTIEEAASLFPSLQERPGFLAAITKHGVFPNGPFRSVHAGQADVTIGRVSSSEDSNVSQYLIDKVVEAKVLAATEVSSEELFCLQLEKLAINSIINPLTTITRLKNGELLEHEQILKLMEVLLEETSGVFQALTDLRGEGDQFNKAGLVAKFYDACRRTAGNTSSMLQDINAGRSTEIDYINGWIVEKGKELGILAESNEKLSVLIKQGACLRPDDLNQHFPMIAL